MAEVWKTYPAETVWYYRNRGCILFLRASPCALSCPVFILLIPKGYYKTPYLAIEVTDIYELKIY